MKISAIHYGQTFRANEQNQQPTKKPVRIHPFTATGWTGAGGFGVAIIAGFMHKPMLHKIAAVVGTTATASHIAMATAHHHSHKEFKA